MSPFLKKILAAGRLVRHGKVAEATAAIQRALGSEPVTPGRSPYPSASAGFGPSTEATTIEEVPATEPSWLDIEGLFGAEPVVERPITPRFEESSFTCAAGTRTFKLFVPAGAGSAPRPLVVMLHGCTQSPDDFAAGTRMNDLAAAQGICVLYPAQAPRSNAHKCWNWFVPADQRRGDGEPALLAGMTRHVMQTHDIDADRVFVAGLSAGGAMAAILAREYPDLFAAAGIHSGVPPGVAHDVASAFTVMKVGPGAAASWQTPTSASMPLWTAAPPPTSSSKDSTLVAPSIVPVIVFHGDCDSTVAPANADAVIAAALASADSSRRIDRDGRSTNNEGRSFSRTIWHADGATSETPSLAEQWLIHGAGHAWSGGADEGSYTDPAGPDASREMLRFFLEHPQRHGRT